jgi:hypothetical protein
MEGGKYEGWRKVLVLSFYVIIFNQGRPEEFTRIFKNIPEKFTLSTIPAFEGPLWKFLTFSGGGLLLGSWGQFAPFAPPSSRTPCF